MKNFLLTVLGGFALIFSLPAFSATPTDINYCSKGKTFTGSRYSIYTVRCSNGSKREITAWNKRKKWCVGNASKKNCSNDQLKAAKKACNLKK